MPQMLKVLGFQKRRQPLALLWIAAGSHQKMLTFLCHEEVMILLSLLCVKQCYQEQVYHCGGVCHTKVLRQVLPTTAWGHLYPYSAHIPSSSLSSPVVQCVARRAPICSNAYGGWFAPCPRHSVRMTYRFSAALWLLGSLRISHNKFLQANKWILSYHGPLTNTQLSLVALQMCAWKISCHNLTLLKPYILKTNLKGIVNHFD